MVEIDKSRRFFIGTDGETVYYIESPTADDIRKADWQYSKTYTQCMIEGITTQAELVDILTKRGIIGPEFERRADELFKNLEKKLELLAVTKDTAEKEKLAIDASAARAEMYQWNQRLTGPMNNSAEQISDNARLEHLTSCMVVNKEGKRLWDSYQKYMEEKDQTLSMRAVYEVMLFLRGLDSDFMNQTPEAVAMKEIEQDIVKQADEYVKAVAAVEKEELEDSASQKDDHGAKKKK